MYILDCSSLLPYMQQKIIFSGIQFIHGLMGINNLQVPTGTSMVRTLIKNNSTCINLQYLSMYVRAFVRPWMKHKL